MTGVSATTAGSTVIVGIVGVLMIWLGGRAIIAGRDDARRLDHVHLLHRPGRRAAGVDRLDRHADHRGVRRPRSHPRDPRHADRVDEDATRAAGASTLEGDVAFEDVWFEYNEGQPVLRGVSFHAAPGTTTALVGSSGSGKSTLISLVMAFNRPTQGPRPRRRPGPRRPAADATTASSWRRCCRRTSCSTAPSPRTSATRSRAPRSTEIKEACRIAHCDEFISQFPEGYDTVVGERGIKLSGGQRQRVSIARAILANPRILILDEATSSLDSESEQMIQDGLRSLRAGRTTFVIAHRLSTIRSADQILVLEGGRDRRARHARRAAGAQRTLPAAVRQAVQVRDRPLHQPRRGLHAGAGEADGAGRVAQSL